MNRTLTLAMAGLVGTVVGTLFFAQSGVSRASDLTLYGSVAAPDGGATVDLVFRDPRTRDVVGRATTVAEVKGGLYTATVNARDLPPKGLYAVDVAQDGSTILSTFVNLQTATPGTAQTGHVNITGTLRSGRIVASSSLNPVLDVRSTSTAANANTAVFDSVSGTGRGLLAIARGHDGTAGLFQAKGLLAFGVDTIAEGTTGTALRARAPGSGGARAGFFHSGSSSLYAVRVLSPYGGVFATTSAPGSRGVLGDSDGNYSAGVEGRTFGDSNAGV